MEGIAPVDIVVEVQTELYNAPSQIGVVLTYVVVNGTETKIGHASFRTRFTRTFQEAYAKGNAEALAKALGCEAVVKEAVQ